jgi:hypothetical protein
MKNNIFIPVLVILFSLNFNSCIGDLEMEPIDPSISQEFEQDKVFAKIYSSLTLTGQEGPSGKGDVAGIDEGFSAFSRLIWNLNELTSDEAICSWGDNGIPELNFNKWSDSNDFTKGLYGRFYFNITLCNHFLERTADKSDEVTKRQRAEARYMRAMNYYYLLDMFGNVPFTEVVAIDPPQQIKRKDLFAWVEKELIAVAPELYAPKTAPYYRIDRAAAWLLLSRLYINGEVYTTVNDQDGNVITAGQTYWNQAAVYADSVMTHSGYSLAPTFKHLFMGDNAGIYDNSTVNKATNEIIFPIACDGLQTRSWGNSLFLVASMFRSDMKPVASTGAWAGNRARSSLIRKFFPTTINVSDLTDLTTGATVPASRNTRDDRAMFFAKDRFLEIENTGRFVEGYSFAKWTNLRADGEPSHDPLYTDTDIPFMRAAEAYLTYAEAVLRGAPAIGGKTPLSVVNTLRARSKAKQLTEVTLDVILDERAREFFAEGHRRMDLVRFNKFGGNNTYLWPWKGGEPNGVAFSAHYNIFAIPAADLNANPNLVQNPGY